MRALHVLPQTAVPAIALLVVAAATAGQALGFDVSLTQNTGRLTPYQVFELTFQHQGDYRNPTWDVTVDVTFTSPGGEKIPVGGFFFGSSRPQKPIVTESTDARGRTRSTATWPCDPADLWKARYAPSEPGRWTFDYVFQAPGGGRASGSGSFEVVEGRVHRKGWVRINPQNPFRFVFDDGSPYFPVGFQDGVFDNNHNGSALDSAAMEGPFRLDAANTRPAPPPGAMFARGPSMNPQNADVDFGRHARAGFNLWRFSPNNFSIKVFHFDPHGDDDRVDWAEARMVDEMMRLLRKYDIRFFYGIFGFTKAFNDQPQDAEAMARVRRIIKYSVDRWGAYVDFWEMLNEQHADDAWYGITVPYLKSIDPYQKPVATSWQRPKLECIDLNAPHWYQNEDELTSDRVTAARARETKRYGKPVVYGEQGNTRGREDRTAQGIGGVWDPGSARRMRVRLWTAMFSEISFIFWETSYAKDGHFMNIWIGPEERQYVRALQDFAYRLDTEVKMVDVPLEGPGADRVRAYGLRSDGRAAVYLHHFGCAECITGGRAKHRWDHDRGSVRGLEVSVDVPRSATGYWYDPRDASILQRLDVQAGPQTFTAPPFEIDVALLFTDADAPDVDHDGVANDRDDDDDGDGVADTADAFPLEREEWVDVDGDRIGDNLDADVNADGLADDRNRNGMPDNEEPDLDVDGVANADALPWDAFPRDPDEQLDSDGDGLGDNADPDDDGDGYSDAEETLANTDPLDALSFPHHP